MSETVTVSKKVNKSPLVIKAFKTLGLNATANDVIAAIEKDAGVTVKVGLVNNIRHRLKNKRKVVKPAENDEFSRLVAVKEFAAKMGGLDALKKLVAKLDALSA